MNKEQIKRTKEWWRDLNTYPSKLSSWLRKLETTEIGGCDEHYHFIAKHGLELSDRETSILKNIAEDERKHSGLLIDLMYDRKINTDQASLETSRYWDYMNSKALKINDYFAVNFFGEALAAERFEIILGESYTPGDIRQVITKILPDEIFHRVTLERLAGEESLDMMLMHHNYITDRIMNKR